MHEPHGFCRRHLQYSGGWRRAPILAVEAMGPSVNNLDLNGRAGFVTLGWHPACFALRPMLMTAFQTPQSTSAVDGSPLHVRPSSPSALDGLRTGCRTDAGPADLHGDLRLDSRPTHAMRGRHVEGRRAAAIDRRGAVSARKDLGLRPGQRLGVGRLQRRVRHGHCERTARRPNPSRSRTFRTSASCSSTPKRARSISACSAMRAI